MSSSPPGKDTHYPLLIILSGPSGVGKDAVLSRMRELGKPYHFTVTATTRPRRPYERDGLDYIFVTSEEFCRWVRDDELMEWAEVYGNLYGVPKAQVIDTLRSGRDVIVKPDVQGASTIRKLAPEAVFIFLAPPDLRELKRRLTERMTERPESLDARLRTAEAEMGQAGRFDHVVVNHQDRLDDAVEEIGAIVEMERRRDPPRKVFL